MLIYHDLFTDDEVCTDANKITFENGLMMVKCKYVKRTCDTKFDTGANASQEEAQEEYEDAAEQAGIDVCINHDLEDVTNYYENAKQYNTYLKTYVKNLGKKLKKEGKSEKLAEILEALNTLKKIVTDNEDDIQFFKAPYKDCEQAEQEEEDSLPPECFHIPIRRMNDSGESMMYFVAAGLREEKA